MSRKMRINKVNRGDGLWSLLPVKAAGPLPAKGPDHFAGWGLKDPPYCVIIPLCVVVKTIKFIR